MVSLSGDVLSSEIEHSITWEGASNGEAGGVEGLKKTSSQSVLEKEVVTVRQNLRSP
jgi:hypothetical protein